MRPAALKAVSTERIVYQLLNNLHPSGILAIVGMRSGGGVSVRGGSGVSVRGVDVGKMVRDILLGLIRDIGVVESSLEAGSAEAH